MIPAHPDSSEEKVAQRKQNKDPFLCPLVLQIRHQLRDLEEMISERGVKVDQTTLFRLVQHYAQLMEKRMRWYQRNLDATWPPVRSSARTP
jgi:transposase-like protein